MTNHDFSRHNLTHALVAQLGNSVHLRVHKIQLVFTGAFSDQISKVAGNPRSITCTVDEFQNRYSKGS